LEEMDVKVSKPWKNGENDDEKAAPLVGCEPFAWLSAVAGGGPAAEFGALSHG
jgi:hypothetical protein